MIHRIAPENVTGEDVRWLVKATDWHYGGYSAITVMEEALQGLVQLWRMDGETKGILVTYINVHPAGKELFIQWVAGKHFIKDVENIKAKLEQFAQEQNCRWIGGAVNSKGLEHIYTRCFGAKQRDRLFNIEVDYGRT